MKSVTDAWLESLDAPGSARIEIPMGEVTLGRLAPSNILIESAVVSHLHAKIQRTADHVIVQDLDSANGTYVNGTRARGPVVLKNGDTLAIAGVRKYRVQIAGDSAAKAQETTRRCRMLGQAQSTQECGDGRSGVAPRGAVDSSGPGPLESVLSSGRAPRRTTQ